MSDGASHAGGDWERSQYCVAHPVFLFSACLFVCKYSNEVFFFKFNSLCFLAAVVQISPSVRYHPTVCRPSVYFYSFWFHLAPFLIFFRAYCLFLFYFFVSSCSLLFFLFHFSSLFVSSCLSFLLFSAFFFFPRSAIHNAVSWLHLMCC